MTSASRPGNVSTKRLCPVCGTRLPYEWKVSHPDLMKPIDFCVTCGAAVDSEGKLLARSQAEWAEHYDGEILRMPDIEL